MLRLAPTRLALALLFFPALRAQVTAPAPVPTTPQPITGTVLNAATNQPVYRALVRLNGGQAQRAVLTDAEGRFTFAAVDPVQISLSAQKPGYSFNSSSEQSALQVKPEAFADPVTLRLYPEAILKGSVSNAAAEPLANIPVEAHRTLTDPSAGRRTSTVAVTRSNSRGQFRLAVPAGDYRIETTFTRLSSARAVLPTTYPPPSDIAQTGTAHVRAGDQLTLDLRPTVTSLIDTIVHVDQSGTRSLQDAEVIPPAGQPFNIPFTISGSPEQIHMSLPTGSYTLQIRHFLADGIDSSHVDLAPTQTSPASVTLHFSPIANLLVEIRVDDTAAAAGASSGQTLNPPSPNSLGVFLEPTGTNALQDAEAVRPTQHYSDQASSVAFSAPAGTYRLRARPGNNWYIVSAICGGVDLLAHDLLVSSSAATNPIQLTVSNLFATIKGTVSADTKPAAAWIYLLANHPAATPVLTIRSNDDGTFTDTNLPPGDYRVLAFSQRHPFDPDDPDSLAAYATRIASVTVQTGDAPSTLNLSAVPDQDIRP